MSQNHEENHEVSVPGYPNLRNGGTNKGGTGRPSDEFKREAGQSLREWLNVSKETLAKYRDQVTDLQSAIQFSEAAGKLADRFGKYSDQLPKQEVQTDMTITVRRVNKATGEE